MGDLAERMHPRIGAAGAAHLYALAAKSLDGGDQGALHRRTLILDLPTQEGRAVIFDGELVAGHDFSETAAAA